MSDKYAEWEEPKATRQGYATECVQRAQRLAAKPIPFAVLVDLFRKYGEEFDRWEGERGEAA